MRTERFDINDYLDELATELPDARAALAYCLTHRLIDYTAVRNSAIRREYRRRVRTACDRLQIRMELSDKYAVSLDRLNKILWQR